MRSNVTRRISAARSASGCILSPRWASDSLTIASIGDRLGTVPIFVLAKMGLSPLPPFGIATFGTATGCNGTNDQCGWYSAPSAIHWRSFAISSLLRWPSLETGGGIRTSGSSLDPRDSISLSLGLPGTIAPNFTATSRLSKRSSMPSFFVSPWQMKHLSDRIGRMSRLNCIGSPRAGAAVPSARIDGNQSLRTTAENDIATISNKKRAEGCGRRELSGFLHYSASSRGMQARPWPFPCNKVVATHSLG